MSAIPTLANVTAAILAGGLGTRLSAVVADRQKVVATVRGRPWLATLLDQLVDAGVREAVLCTGHRGEQVTQAFGDRYRELRLRYSQEPEPLGTGGALRLALPMLSGDPVLAMNGDSYCAADLKPFLERHWAWEARATLLLTQVADRRRFGSVDTGPDHAVRGFVEKGGDPGPGWINAGVYLLSREVIAAIPTGRRVSLEHEVFPAWVGKGLFAHPGGGRFLDIGTPADYASAEGFTEGAPSAAG